MKRFILFFSLFFLYFYSFGQTVASIEDTDSVPSFDKSFYIYDYYPIGTTNDGSSIIYYENFSLLDGNLTVISNGDKTIILSDDDYSFGDDIGLFYVMKTNGNNIYVDVYNKETFDKEKSYTLTLPNDISSNVKFITFDNDSLLLYAAYGGTVYCYHGNLNNGTISLNTQDYESFTVNTTVNKIKAISTFDENNDEIAMVLVGDGLGIFYLLDNKEGEYIIRQTFGGNKDMSLIDGYFEGEDYAKGYIHLAKIENDTLYICQYNLVDNVIQNWQQYSGNVKNSCGVNFIKTYTQIDNETIQQKIKLLAVSYSEVNGNEVDNVYSVTKNSDKLVYRGTVKDVPTSDVLADVYDLVAVVEGPPPFPMNGYSLLELNSPSTLIVGNSEGSSTTTELTDVVTTSFSNEITTGASISAGVGIGAIKVSAEVSYHKTWQESGDTTNTTTNTITSSQKININTNITTPTADEEASMIYIYLAPSIEKINWELIKPDGTSYTPVRNVTFINFTTPQLKFETKPLSDFDKSPSIFDIYSYQNRGINELEGATVEDMIELQQDIAQGISQTFSLNFTNSLTFSHSVTTSITKETIKKLEVGIGLEDTNKNVKVFHFNVSADISTTQISSTTESYTYKRSYTTSVGKTFNLSYNIPKPKDLSDDSNIRSFTTKFYLMKTDSDDAYYLTDEFKGYRPLFITYEVKNIETGSYITPVEESMNLKIYPNPVHNNLYLNNIPDNSTLQISDLQGKIIIKTKTTGQTLDVSALKAGIYFIKIENNNGIYTSKFIKE